MCLKLTLLSLLDQTGGFLLPEESLVQQTLLRHPDASRGAASSALADLEALGWAVSVPSRLEPGRRWGLTDEGLAQLRQRRL